MRVLEGESHRGPIVSSAILVSALGVLGFTVLTGDRVSEIAPLVAVVAVATVAYRRVLSWQGLVAAIVLVIFFVPIKRYLLPARLAFNLEPYRLMVMLVVAAWGTSLLIDRRVRFRRSGLEAPIAVVVVAVLGSDLANPARVGSLGSYVIKSLSFFVSYILVFYLIVSVIRDRIQLDFLLKIIVASAALISVSAIFERRTGYNVFNHLQGVVPLLRFQGAPTAAELERNGNLRAYASAQHPIALGVALVMLIPIAIYLTRASRRWWICVVLIALAAFSTGSRTTFIGLVVVLITYLALRPTETKRQWPALIPLLLAVHVALPGALGTIRAAFFPKGGLIAEQSQIVQGNQALANNRLADIGPSLHEYSDHNPVVGEGFGTRVTGFGAQFVNAPILDDQWLGTLLEIGLLGVVGWLWLYVRSIRRLAREAKQDRSSLGWLSTGLAASLAVFAVSMLTLDSFSFIQVTFLLFILLGIASALPAVRGRQIGQPSIGQPSAPA